MSGAEQYQKNAHNVASNEQLVLLIFGKGNHINVGSSEKKQVKGRKSKR